MSGHTEAKLLSDPTMRCGSMGHWDKVLSFATCFWLVQCFIYLNTKRQQTKDMYENLWNHGPKIIVPSIHWLSCMFHYGDRKLIRCCCLFCFNWKSSIFKWTLRGDFNDFQFKPTPVFLKWYFFLLIMFQSAYPHNFRFWMSRQTHCNTATTQFLHTGRIDVSGIFFAPAVIFSFEIDFLEDTIERLLLSPTGFFHRDALALHCSPTGLFHTFL